eukprot:4023585-Pyramimonas_sp.AAC.1
MGMRLSCHVRGAHCRELCEVLVEVSGGQRGGFLAAHGAMKHDAPASFRIGPVKKASLHGRGRHVRDLLPTMTHASFAPALCFTSQVMQTETHMLKFPKLRRKEGLGYHRRVQLLSGFGRRPRCSLPEPAIESLQPFGR